MDLSAFYPIVDDFHRKRAEELYNRFIELNGKKPEYVISSPGRAEILGNHTDHNHGKVMVAAINCDILCFVSPEASGKITIHSDGFSPIVTNVNDTEINEKQFGTSLALVKGVCAKIKSLGYTVGGFTACATSNISKGAGVSSSAAYEVMIAEIFNMLYLGGKLTAVDKAVISQYAENVYFGKPCGLLDQSGIAIGSLSKLDFKTSLPEITKLAPPAGYTIVLTNTGGDHAKLTEHYAAIRVEMENVAAYFGKKVLREVDYNEFLAAIPQLKKSLSSRAILRAMHYYSENQRVDEAEVALLNNDIQGFLKAVSASGESSLAILQNCYVPGSVDQPVVLAVEYSKRIVKDGAFRVHGGGFAGSVLGIVNNNEAEMYVFAMKKVFGEENVFTALVRPTGTCGAKL